MFSNNLLKNPSKFFLLISLELILVSGLENAS